MAALFNFLRTTVLFLALLCSKAFAADMPKFVADEYPPYNYLNQKGEVVGISVEILTRIMLQIDSEFSPDDIALVPWARAYKQLQESNQTTLFTMIKTQEREKMFKFVGPISSSNMVVVTKNPTLQIVNLNDLSKYRVAVVRDGLGDQMLQSMNPQKTDVFRLLNTEQVTGLLIKDRVDAIVLDESIVKYQLKKSGENPKQYHFKHSVNYSGTYFAFNKNVDPEYFSRFESEFTKLKSSGVIEQIYQNHLDNL